LTFIKIRVIKVLETKALFLFQQKAFFNEAFNYKFQGRSNNNNNNNFSFLGRPDH